MDNNEEPKKVSERIVEIISAEETSSVISDICSENGVEDEKKIEDVSYQVGLVLLGQLPPNLLADSLKEEVKLSEEASNNIVERIGQSIFSKVEDDLSALYAEGVEAKPEPEPEPELEKPAPSIPEPKEESKRPPKGKDTYREKVEE